MEIQEWPIRECQPIAGARWIRTEDIGQIRRFDFGQ